MAVTREQIDSALRQALTPLHLEVHDDSHLHVGHAGAREGRHFSVAITAEAFRGQSRLRRHRLVYDAVAPLIPQGIHALAIVAQTPDEA
jgi:BolA family transcriptional regulator, general stress-responsive regulator